MAEQQRLLTGETLEPLPPEAVLRLQDALQDLVAPELERRVTAVERLLGEDAHRRSPLAATMLAHRVHEPALRLRKRILSALGEVIRPPAGSGLPPPVVRRCVQSVLAELGEREVEALLEAAGDSEQIFSVVCWIMDQCSSAGDILIKIAEDRTQPLPMRILAIDAVGRIGYLEALPRFQRLEKRLLGKATGQLRMTFAPRRSGEAKVLLPVLQRALESLREADI
jgi:hypothetical protein